MPTPSPTVRRRRLAQELRRIRTQLGLTHEQVEALSGGDIGASSVSRWETARRGIRPTDLRVLLGLYNDAAAAAGAERITPEEQDGLVTLARQASQRGWWQAEPVPPWFATYIGLETEADSIHEYVAELVPGLLQIPDYYRAFLQEAPSNTSEDDIEQKITLRLARQKRFSEDSRPEYWAVMSEASIQRVVGGPRIMKTQLLRITELSSLPGVTVQVLPFDAGAHPAMDGGFSILGFPELTHPNVVYLEYQAGSLILEEIPETDRYVRMFGHLIAKALSPDDSRQLIMRTAAGLGE